MSTLVQDLIVSAVALGAMTMIGVRARAMFAYAESPEPPMPTKYSRRPARGLC